MKHSRGVPYYPQTQGRIEGWHQTLKSHVLLGNHFIPGNLKAQYEAIINDYNHQRYNESLSNITPSDVYFGRDKAILKKGKVQTKDTRNTALASKTRRRIM